MSLEQLLEKLTTFGARNVVTHWNEVRGDRLMPAWSDINPSVISKQLENVWSWKYNIEEDSFLGRLAGEKIIEALGGSIRGQDAQTFFANRGGEIMLDRARSIVHGPRIFYGQGAIFRHTERLITGERVVLPLSENGNIADGMLGVTMFTSPDSIFELHEYPDTEVGELISFQRRNCPKLASDIID